MVVLIWALVWTTGPAARRAISGNVSPEVGTLVLRATPMTFPAVFRIELEAHVEAAIVAAATGFAATLRAHVLLLFRLLCPEMDRRRVFNFEN